jgi:hypothetical protein
MRARELVRQAPLLVLLIVGGFAIAQTIDNDGRDVPYLGYIEENGAPVSDLLDMQFRLYTSASGGVLCATQDDSDVTVSAGRFGVELSDLPDTCFDTGELYIELSVGPAGGQLADIGGRQRVASVPFATASPKDSTMIIGEDLEIVGDVLLSNTSINADGSAAFGGAVDVGGALDANVLTVEDTTIAANGNLTMGGNVFVGNNRMMFRDGAQSGDARSDRNIELTGVDASYDGYGVELRARENPPAGAAIFRVLSSAGAERLRVEHDGEVYVGDTNDLRVNNDVYVDGQLHLSEIATSSDDGCLRLGTMQICWGSYAGDGWKTSNFVRDFANGSYSVNCTPAIGSTSNLARHCTTRALGAGSFEHKTWQNDGSNSGAGGHYIAIGSAGSEW